MVQKATLSEGRVNWNVALRIVCLCAPDMDILVSTIGFDVSRGQVFDFLIPQTCIELKHYGGFQRSHVTRTAVSSDLFGITWRKLATVVVLFVYRKPDPVHRVVFNYIKSPVIIKEAFQRGLDPTEAVAESVFDGDISLYGRSNLLFL